MKSTGIVRGDAVNTFEATISPTIAGYEPMRASVETANRWLEGVIGPSTATVKAKWDLNRDADGRELITLRLSDFTSPQGVVEVFRPTELGDRTHMERRFYRQFGDLLQLQSHVLLNNFATSSSAGE
jgi:hypothetical protein